MLELSEIVRNFGLVIGAAIAVMIAAWRSHAANRQANAALAQSALAQRGHVTETFNRAIDQLRDDKLEVRLGAIYTLRMIYSQRPLTEYRQPIVEILTAYGRERTS